MLSFFHAIDKPQRQIESPDASVSSNTEREEPMLVRAVHQVVKTETLLSVESIKNKNYKYRKYLISFVSCGAIKQSKECKVSV